MLLYFFFLAQRDFILFLETSLLFGSNSWLSGSEPFQATATGYWRQKEPGGSEKAPEGQVNALGQWGHPHQVSHCFVRDFLRQTQQTALECTVMSNCVFFFVYVSFSPYHCAMNQDILCLYFKTMTLKKYFLSRECQIFKVWMKQMWYL